MKKGAKKIARLEIAQKLKSAFPELSEATPKARQKRALKKASKAISAAIKPGTQAV